MLVYKSNKWLYRTIITKTIRNKKINPNKRIAKSIN